MEEKKLIRGFIKQEPIGFISFILLLAVIIPAVFAPIFAPYDPYKADLSNSLSAPSLSHILGTDELSRDIFSRIIFGTRTSLMMGFGPTSINLILGALIGMYSGLAGKKTDNIIMRIVDINLFLALVLVGWASIARIVRSETISLKENLYIEAAKSMGAGTFSIMVRHILPNIVPTLIVLYTMSVPSAILSEAGLSFLGFGAQPPSTSLGIMIQKGKDYLFDAPWISLGPGFVLLIIAMSFNFLGDSLRKYFDIKIGK